MIVFCRKKRIWKNYYCKFTSSFYQRKLKGNIYIDKKDINDYNLLDLRASIAYLTQEAIIFNRSIWDNITYYKSINDIAEIKDLLIQTASYDMIHKLPLGMETIIKSDLGNLSGGEKQRIALVRELLKDAKIIIFDEATASVDPITERIIHQTIVELSMQSTVIVITHKLSIAKEGGLLYIFLKDGSIEESGTHTTLLKEKGEYYKLVKEEGNGEFDMYKYKIKKQFKILDFSGKKIYLEKGASDSIFEISDTMEELLFLLKDGITLKKFINTF